MRSIKLIVIFILHEFPILKDQIGMNMSTQTSLKKTKIFHPFLVAIFPVMVIYSENIGKVDIQDLILGKMDKDIF